MAVYGQILDLTFSNFTNVNPCHFGVFWLLSTFEKIGINFYSSVLEQNYDHQNLLKGPWNWSMQVKRWECIVWGQNKQSMERLKNWLGFNGAYLTLVPKVKISLGPQIPPVGEFSEVLLCCCLLAIPTYSKWGNSSAHSPGLHSPSGSGQSCTYIST